MKNNCFFALPSKFVFLSSAAADQLPFVMIFFENICESSKISTLLTKSYMGHIKNVNIAEKLVLIRI